MLQAQGHMCVIQDRGIDLFLFIEVFSRQKDVLHFCHTSVFFPFHSARTFTNEPVACGLFDGGSVESYLTIVKRWLDSHPNEVLTLVFTNPEKASVDTVWAPIFQKTGIADMAFVPAQTSMTRDDWPTLGEMISSGKRVVIFLDHGAEARSDPASAYILPQFQMVRAELMSFSKLKANQDTRCGRISMTRPTARSLAPLIAQPAPLRQDSNST